MQSSFASSFCRSACCFSSAVVSVGVLWEIGRVGGEKSSLRVLHGEVEDINFCYPFAWSNGFFTRPALARPRIDGTEHHIWTLRGKLYSLFSPTLLIKLGRDIFFIVQHKSAVSSSDFSVISRRESCAGSQYRVYLRTQSAGTSVTCCALLWPGSPQTHGARTQALTYFSEHTRGTVTGDLCARLAGRDTSKHEPTLNTGRMRWRHPVGPLSVRS